MSGRKRGSSRAWLQEHESDRWVQRARAEGYRSRASFKLLEIQRRDRLIRPGQTVVDLGAAPGGWSQVAAELVGERGLVLATDLLPMDSLAGEIGRASCRERLVELAAVGAGASEARVEENGGSHGEEGRTVVAAARG